MKFRTAFIISIVVSSSTNFQVHANENPSSQEVLATAKIAGACGILDAMIHFQKTTKMNGGDEFVSRFWAVEAVRLGISVQQLSRKCDDAVIRYDKMWKSMEKKPK